MHGRSNAAGPFATGCYNVERVEPEHVLDETDRAPAGRKGSLNPPYSLLEVLEELCLRRRTVHDEQSCHDGNAYRNKTQRHGRTLF